MSDDEKASEDKKWLVDQTADLLLTAGRVIQEMKEREAEDGTQDFDSDISERVLVAQLLAIVASSKKTYTDLKDIEAAAMKAAQDRLASIRKRIKEFSPPLPADVQSAMESAAPQGWDVPGIFPSPKDCGDMKLSVCESADGWLVILHGRRVLVRNCKTFDELVNALGWAAISIAKPSAEPA